MDWNLYRCGRAGHVTYAPDEPALKEHLGGRTAAGELWQCVRCGTYVPGPPQASGPLAQAPLVRRGKEIRSEIILRLFAIERLLRFLLFGALAYGAFRFAQSPTIERAFNHDYPIFRNLFRQLGFDVSHSRILGLYRRALHLSKSTLRWIAIGLAAFAVVELIEGVGLWLAKRWGEYFAAAVTALGLPYEIYDLTGKITATRIILFILNLALVLYLILTKRLFGARGGKRAYEARLRSESIFDTASRAVAMGQQDHATEASRPDAADSARLGDLADSHAAAKPDGSAAPASPATVVEPATPPGPATPVRPADPTLPMRPGDPRP